MANANITGFEIKRLSLDEHDRIDDSFVNNLSSIVARCELNRIDISMREDEGRVRILESIQWKHLRYLYIYLKPRTFETRVMRALVDGVTKMSEKVELDWFRFTSEEWNTPVTLPEGDLLQTFVAATSIEWLILNVDMTLEQILSLLRSTDFSRLERLKLWTEGFDPVKVDAIIGGLLHATSLKKLILHGANITAEQKSQMKAKGVALTSHWWDW